MSNATTRHYFIVWLWLLALVVLSVVATLVLPKVTAVVLIFTAAIIKALLVARNYMHLKSERAITYAMVLVPLTFVIILLFGLVPDFVFHR